MAATPSIRIVSSFTYRGATQLFSSRFHFSGGTPADLSAWHALAEDIIAGATGGVRYGILAPLPSHVTVVRAIGYDASSDVSVYDEDFSLNGDSVVADHASGDSCMLLRWLTAARSSKGHPIYLFSYLHGACSASSTDGDTLDSGMRTRAQDFAQRWWDAGFTDGTNTYKRAGPNGATAVSSEVDPFVRHRDFPT